MTDKPKLFWRIASKAGVPPPPVPQTIVEWMALVGFVLGGYCLMAHTL